MARTLFSIAADDRVVIDGIHYVLRSMVPSGVGSSDERDDFQFEDTRVNRITTFSQRKFLKLYSKGKVRILSRTERVTDRVPEILTADGTPDLCAERALVKARKRLAYLQAYDAAPVSKSTFRLQAFIDETADRLADSEPPSPGALRRWIAERGVADNRRLHEMVGRHPRGAKGYKLQARVEAIVDEESARFWNDVAISATEVWDRVADRVNAENIHGRLSGDDLLVRPALSTVCLRLRQHATLDRACRRWGKREGLRRFGLLKGAMVAESILDLAIIDHTILDCWVIDEITGQPIGRPRLTVMMDSCSRYPLGFHLGWKDGSVEAVMACLKHAILPKDYVKERYPDIRHDWLAFGQPRAIVPDQGLEFMGRSFEDACATLGISIEPAPVRTPEWKGQVERMFGTLNTGAIHKLPGGVPFKPALMKEFDIDPEKTAVLTLAELDEIIHRFFVDIYAREVHRTLEAAPAKVWLDHTNTDVIELCRDTTILDKACATITTGKLTKEGVRLNNLTYRSDQLKQLRVHLARGGNKRDRQTGSMGIKIAYHTDDVSRISVWDPVLNDYIEAFCTKSKYTRGLSLHLHQMIRAWAAKANREFQSEADMCAARVAFYERIREIRESRVVDRKRLQRVRHAERPAHGDRVEVRTVSGARGYELGENVVRTETARNRVDAHRIETRTPVGGNRKAKRRDGATDARQAQSSAGLPLADAPSPLASINWGGLIVSARSGGDV